MVTVTGTGVKARTLGASRSSTVATNQHEQSDAFHTYPPFSVSGNGAVKSQVQELRGALDRGVPRVDADAAYVYERH
jgi:hypothetical protein